MTALQNIRYGLRVFARNPGFTAAAVLCLTLGIGATTAIFSLVNSVVLRPLPYANASRLVRVFTEFPTFPNGGLRHFGVSPPEYLDLKRELFHLMKQRHERITAQAITRIIVNSYHSHEFVMEVWGINASFCPLGVEIEQFFPDNTSREEFVLSVGAMVPHKGFPFLVRALGRLPEQIRPELVLVCNFEYPEQRAAVEAEAKRSNGRVRILVDVSEDQLTS